MKARLYIDGGSRGNPGPAAYGFVLEAEDRTVLDKFGEKIGFTTNNVAEYMGLIAGLQRAIDFGISELEIISDSELIIRQMTGEYRVKNETLRELHFTASILAEKINENVFRNIRREHNIEADRLVNEALDR